MTDEDKEFVKTWFQRRWPCFADQLFKQMDDKNEWNTELGKGMLTQARLEKKVETDSVVPTFLTAEEKVLFVNTAIILRRFLEVTMDSNSPLKWNEGGKEMVSAYINHIDSYHKANYNSDGSRKVDG